MNSVERIVTLAAGLLAGLLAGWILRSFRKTPPDSRVEEELRAQLSRSETECRELRTAAAAAAATAAGADAGRAAAQKESTLLSEKNTALTAQADRLREELASAKAALAGATAEVDAAKTMLTEQRRFHEENERALREHQARTTEEMRAAHEKALAELKQAFAGLSAEALKQSGPEFIRLANETFAKFQETAKGDLSTREQRIETLVKPLEEQLKAYQQRLQQSESSQSAALGEVKKHLEHLATQSQTLSSETQRLRVVLSSNQARGRWGEETLRRVVEAAGMSAHCDFTEQVREGDSMPDLVVRLPGERLIIVDSKVPDLEFVSALNSAVEAQRAEILAEHAAKLRSTIKALADRDYPGRFPGSLDHVVLFLPAESLFSAALESDHELIVWAAERKILIATPASLIALLRSVSVSWQQHEQSQNAREIARAAQTLYERVAKFVEHFERIRDGLGKASKAYDDAVGSYERMVRPSGERLARLGGGVESKTMPEIRPLDTSLRLPPNGQS